MYATVQDMRDEGVTEAQASDARLTLLLVEASELIDNLAGWNFAPREWTLRLDGSGRSWVEPPVVPIVLSELWIDGRRIAASEFWLVGAPVAPGFVAPRIALSRGVFPRGQGNILAKGMWGYTEADGTPLGHTPLAIRRACMLLVMQFLPQIGDQDAVQDARDRWRIVEQRTRDQSIKFAVESSSGARGQHCSDPEVDAILGRYARPMQLGAV